MESAQNTPDKCIFLNKERPLGESVPCEYVGCTLLVRTIDPTDLRTIEQEPPATNICEAGRAKPKS